MPYMAVGPDVRVGAKTLPDLLARIDQGDADVAGISRRLLAVKSRPEFHVRYVDARHPEYGPGGRYVGGRELTDAEQAELDELLTEEG